MLGLPIQPTSLAHAITPPMTTTREAFLRISDAMNAAIIGQQTVVERLIIALLANGNVLMEGLPGTAKTRSIKTLSKLVESEFRRVQFTPDLLPSDVTGSEIYREHSGTFEFQPGPIFGNLVLADQSTVVLPKSDRIRRPEELRPAAVDLDAHSRTEP